MEKPEIYHTIFQRKSIRNFDLTPLDEDTLVEISKYMDNLKPLHDDIKTELKIVSSDDVKTRMMKKAPHYIAVFSEPDDGYLTNIGFMFQQMDLFFSANGFGSCWQGIPKPTKDVLKSSNLEFIILIAFGKPKDPESLHRTSVSEFKRKSLQEITDITVADELMEAVRLAPSATNGQPWFFTGNCSIIHAYRVKSNLITAFVVKNILIDLGLIDMGIAIYHLKVAAEHFGKKTEIVFDKTAKMDTLKGHEYIASLKME